VCVTGIEGSVEDWATRRLTSSTSLERRGGGKERTECAGERHVALERLASGSEWSRGPGSESVGLAIESV